MSAVRVPKYHSVRKVKNVFIVILIPKLSLNFVVALAAGVKFKQVFIVISIPKRSINFVVALAAGVKSKPSSRERFFLRTANPKRAAAHRRPGPERGVAAYRRTPEREQTILIG